MAIETLISGGIGILGTLLGITLKTWLDRRNQKQKTADENLFQLYMLLIDARGRHFWITTSEMHNEAPKPEMIHNFNSLRWQIADLARKIDTVPEVDRVLRALFSYGFASEKERAQTIDSLIDRLGDQVNPRYKQVMRDITAETEKLSITNLEELFRRQRRLPPG